VRLPYALTADAGITLDLTKNGRRVARVRRSVSAGRRTLVWNGKATRGRGRGKPVAPGRYLARLAARSADGQTSKDMASVRIVRSP
jgi:hypothetical protein